MLTQAPHTQERLENSSAPGKSYESNGFLAQPSSLPTVTGNKEPVCSDTPSHDTGALESSKKTLFYTRAELKQFQEEARTEANTLGFTSHSPISSCVLAMMSTETRENTKRNVEICKPARVDFSRPQAQQQHPDVQQHSPASNEHTRTQAAAKEPTPSKLGADAPLQQTLEPKLKLASATFRERFGHKGQTTPTKDSPQTALGSATTPRQTNSPCRSPLDTRTFSYSSPLASPNAPVPHLHASKYRGARKQTGNNRSLESVRQLAVLSTQSSSSSLDGNQSYHAASKSAHSSCLFASNKSPMLAKATEKLRQIKESRNRSSSLPPPLEEPRKRWRSSSLSANRSSTSLASEALLTAMARRKNGSGDNTQHRKPTQPNTHHRLRSVTGPGEHPSTPPHTRDTTEAHFSLQKTISIKEDDALKKERNVWFHPNILQAELEKVKVHEEQDRKKQERREQLFKGHKFRSLCKGKEINFSALCRDLEERISDAQCKLKDK